MNTLSLVGVLVLFGLMVVLGAVLVVFSARKLRRRLRAGVGAKSAMAILLLQCFPLAVGIVFVAYGITAIGKIIGFGELAGGTTLTVANIAAQSIPVVVVLWIAYILHSYQRHS